VTATGPCAGDMPFSSIRISASAAVKPAVPSAIAVRASRPGGSRMTLSASARV